jgi:hypothetical protein
MISRTATALKSWEEAYLHGILAGSAGRDALLVTVNRLVDAAVARERERCAQVAGDHAHQMLSGYEIAVLIRREPRP